MTDDRIITLLEETRDLQRKHAAIALMVLVVVLVAVFLLPYIMR